MAVFVVSSSDMLYNRQFLDDMCAHVFDKVLDGDDDRREAAVAMSNTELSKIVSVRAHVAGDRLHLRQQVRRALYRHICICFNVNPAQQTACRTLCRTLSL